MSGLQTSTKTAAASSPSTSTSSWCDMAHAEAQGFLDFNNASPTPYHAVHEVQGMLQAAGFEKLSERDSWKGRIQPGGKYVVTRGQTSLVSFALGTEYKAGHGLSMVGAHTDSCTFKVRPISKKDSEGYLRVGVETYGGGLWHSWLDRDLGLAGRVITSTGEGENKTLHNHLVTIRRPILRIPTVAIHLDRSQNEKTHYNTEQQLVPILGLASSALNAPASSSSERHTPMLLQLLAEHLSLQSIEQVEDFDLRLFDVQPPTLGGVHNEFIFAARLDNLFSTYAAGEALATSSTDASLKGQTTGRMIAIWDHEEVGSKSAVGAESNFLESVLGRLTTALKTSDTEEEALHQTIANSFMVSADMGHAYHPSFPEKHEINLRPKMNEGPAIKANANQRYATTTETDFLLKQIAAKVGVPLQEYGVRNDMPCGSTIGPISSVYGVRTVDIGCAQLSMHSIRETCGSKDVGHLLNLFKGYFEHYAQVDEALRASSI